MEENTITPSTEAVRRRYQECRYGGQSHVESGAEFDRFLAAHDQGIRDAVEPPELTAKEHLEAAFEAAYPVPKWRDVPVGVPLIARLADGNIWVYATGFISWNAAPTDRVDVRTLEPLPPVIPDDCNAVWASTRGDESRRVWVRVTGFTPGREDGWDDGNLDAWFAKTSELINPVPIPEEES